MKANANFLKMILLMFTLIMASCDGEDGEDGAIGPAGPQGEQGIQGPTGAEGADGQNGTNGEDGNANVIASDWIATSFDASAVFFSSFNVADANITDETVNSAAILVYGRFTTGGGVVAWPYVIGIGGNKFYDFQPDPTAGELIIRGASIDGTTEVFDDFSDVRYVIVPASTTSKNSTIDLEKMDYYEVMDYLNLPY